LYLIHGPWIIPNGDVERLWDDIIEVREAGLTEYVYSCALHPRFSISGPAHRLPVARLAPRRSIGVSNFTLELLQRVVEMGKVLPAVNQVHIPLACRVRSETRSQINLHPYNYASWKDVLEFSAKHGIVTEAYGTLACVSSPSPFLHFFVSGGSTND
jgi:hypothetical protein